MKLWDKGYTLDEKIESFTVGKDRELDLLLAPFDILGTMAHTTMLSSVGLLSEEHLSPIRKELLSLLQKSRSGRIHN